MTVNYHVKKFYNIANGAKVIKLFTMVIYPHSVVIPIFFVIKLYYHGMAVNYCSILTLEKVELKLPW
jgi:hypothetical protein